MLAGSKPWITVYSELINCFGSKSIFAHKKSDRIPAAKKKTVYWAAAKQDFFG